MTNTVNRVAKNTLILYIRMGITMIISIYSTRLILKALGESDFGIYTVVGGMITMLTFLNAAMTAASQRFMSYAQGEGDIQKQNTIFNISLQLHIFIGILIVLLLEGLGLFLFNGLLNIELERVETAKILYHFMVLSTFLTILSVPYDSVINARENMTLVAILGILSSLIRLAIAITLIYSPIDKLLLYGALTTILTLLILIIRIVYCYLNYTESKLVITNYIQVPLFKEMTYFAGWSFLDTSSGMLGYYGQSLVLNNFFGTTINAAQGIEAQLKGQLGTLAAVVMKALNPLIAKSEGAKNRGLLFKATMSGAKLSSLLLVFVYVPFLVKLPYILKLWLVTVPTYTVTFCWISLCYTLISQIFIPLNSAIAAEGNIKSYQSVNSILNIIPILVSICLFFFNFPPYYIYILFLIGTILKGINTLYYAKLRLKLNINTYLIDVVKPVITIFSINLIITYIISQVLEENIINLFIIFIISFLIFATNMYYVGLNFNEKYKLLEFKNKILIRYKTYLN